MIISHHPSNMTVIVEGNALIENIQDTLKRRDQFIPIGPFCEGVTVRDAIDYNLIGPFSDRFGTIRNWLLNTRLKTRKGEFSTGADVMKNVSGYDLTRILIGGEGHFGSIVQATFKLLPVSKQPKPELPIITGFRIITLPGNFTELMKKLNRMQMNIICYKSLGVADIRTDNAEFPKKFHEIHTEFPVNIIQIQNGLPVNRTQSLTQIHQEIIRLFDSGQGK